MRSYQFVFKNLQQRMSRTAMTIVGVAIAVTAITTLWNSVWGYAQSSADFYSVRNVDIVVVRAGVSNRLTSSLHADLAPRLAALPGISSVDASLTEMVSLGEVHLLGIPLRGVDPNSNAIKQFTSLKGETLKSAGSDVVLVGSGIQASLQPPESQQIEIEGTKFRVLGVFAAQNPFDVNSIIAPLADVQKLLDRPGVVSEFQIRVASESRNSASLKHMCDEIEALTGDDGQPLGLKAQSASQFANGATEGQFGGAMAWATSAIVLVLSFFAIFNTMLMSVMERTPELGLLRSVGWTRKRVMRLIVGESVVLSLVGAIVGLSIAWILGSILSRLPGTTLIVPQHLSYTAIGLGCAAALGAGITGSLYPAFRAASVTPVEALRYE